MAGWLPFFAPAIFGFNGGKSQAQSEYLGTSGDYPFINAMKTMQEWVYVSTNGPINPNDLDTNGYPTVINNGGVYNILFVAPSKTGASFTWVLDWDGRGTAIFSADGGSVTITNGATFSNLSGSSTNRVEFTPPASATGHLTLGISAIQSSADYPRNMRLFLKSEETALNAGFVTSTDFRNLWASAKIGVKRFLNWQNANFGNMTTWATRKPVNFYSWAATEYRKSLFVTATGGTGDAFTGTLGAGAPTDKQTVIVMFDHDAVTSSWTFDLNGTGPIPMVDAGTVYYITSAWPANGWTATLVYDADLNKWLKYGGSGGNQSGIRNALPLEIAVQICSELKCHPYFVIPPLASDPLTDLVTSLDTYIQNNAPSWMIPRYEGPNENWNDVFFAKTYSLLKAIAYWGTNYNGNHFWHGRMISLLGQAVDANRASDRTKYQVMSGVQSGTAFNYPDLVNNITGASNPRLNCVRSKGFIVGTFTTSSANIIATGNAFALNAPVQIVPQNGGSMPTNFSSETTYYIKTTGGTITLSSSPGGSAITCGASAGTDAFSIVNASGLPAYNWVTTVVVTNYVNPAQQDSLGELSDGYRLLTGDTSVVAPYQADNRVTDGVLQTFNQAWYNWAQSFGPALKLAGYEGGWSPDYLPLYNTNWGIISGVTKTTSGNFNTVLTIAQTNYNGGVRSNNAFVVGMPMPIDEVVGMIQLNLLPKNVFFTAGTPGIVGWESAHGFPANQTITFAANGLKRNSAFDCPYPTGVVLYVKDNAPGGDNTKFTVSLTAGGAAINIAAADASPSRNVTCSACWVVTGVSGSSITINCDSSGFSNYTSGGRAFYGCCEGGSQGGAGSANMIIAMRIASKSMPQLQADTLLNYQQFVSSGPLAEFPSCFQVAGANNVWAVWDPDIYAAAPPPQWDGITQFNN